MSKLIAIAEQNTTYKLETRVYWFHDSWDGRVSNSRTMYGTIVKINPKTLDIKTKHGHVYRVEKCDVGLVDDLF
jgi:hypothetical protein